MKFLATMICLALSTTMLSPAQSKAPKKLFQTIGGLARAHENAYGEWQILVNGKPVFSEDSGYTIRFIERFPDNDKAHTILIGTWDGGKQCPSMYRIMHVYANATVKITEQFGNCSDLPTIKVADQKITISFPAFNGKPATWAYNPNDNGLTQEH